MDATLCTSPHLNHAAFQEGVVPLGGPIDGVAQRFVPMGLLSLAGAAPPGVQVAVRDVNKAVNNRELPLGPGFYEEAARWLLRGEPGLVGFMTEADSYHHVLRLCRAIKARRPAVRTLLGGPHASAVHGQTLERCGFVDFVVRGEGEIAFGHLLATLQGAGDSGLSAVGNLSFRHAGAVVSTAELPLVQDLDTLPWPDYDRIDVRDDDSVYVEVGRGCPFQCNFCFTAPYWQRKHRIKSAPRLIEELRQLRDSYGRFDVNLTHDLFTVNRRWVLEFCRELSAADLGVTWTCSSRTDTIDEEQIEALARAGCRNIYFGVETGSQAMQRHIQKNLDLAHARDMIRRTTAAGIGVTVGFIAGLPGESRASLKATVREAAGYLALPDSTVHLFGYSPYQGSAVFHQVHDALRFDPDFVDFPLGSAVREENHALMAADFELFTRYSWPRWEPDLSRETVRAAEEFFPIVNALRDLALDLSGRGVDFYDVLCRWGRWIAEVNLERGAEAGARHRGTIADFLAFLEPYLREVGVTDEVLLERISWEAHLNRLRGAPAMARQYPADGRVDRAGSGGPGGAGSAVAGPRQDRLYLNPTVVRAAFRYAPDFHDDAGPERTYAFYRRVDGSPAIAGLSPLASLLLDLSRDGVVASSAAAMVARVAPASAGLEAAEVESLIDRLRGAGLVTQPLGAGAPPAAEGR